VHLHALRLQVDGDVVDAGHRGDLLRHGSHAMAAAHAGDGVDGRCHGAPFVAFKIPL
jgi:hypothetical protein